MKILMVHNSYQQPGGEDVVFEQEYQLLKRAGHTMVAYRRSNWEVDAYRGLDRLKLLPRTVWASDTRKDIATVLKRERPDLVHAHNTFVVVSPSIFSACHEAGIPVVLSLHNYRLYCPGATFFRNGQVCEECVDHSLWAGVRHGCYRQSRAATAAVALMLTVHRQRQTWIHDVDYYIALTQFARGRFLKAGLPAEKVLVKPNFAYPDPGMREETVGEYALFVGRLSPEKRVNTLLDAWARLRQPIPLLIIGGGPEREHLEQERNRQALKEITFKGQKSRTDVLAAMRRARFLVFSSEWYENFPMTIAEAFACGVPVICSRLGAMQEIVEDGRTGLFFNPGDPQDLAAKVEAAWNDPRRTQELGKEARREYENKYTAESNYPLLMEIYQRVLQAGPPANQMSLRAETQTMAVACN